jgi:outer membrane protein OmpA-like peptidoglycan-associated protein
MRNLAVALALATTALASPVLAKDGSFYVGVDGVAVLTEDSKFDLRDTAGVAYKDSIKSNTKVGYDVDGVVGYDFGMFRTEFEVGYKSSKLDSLQVNGPTGALLLPNGTVGTPAVGDYNNVSGKQNILSFMANGLIDFGGEGNSIGGFVGGGVGVARVKQKGFAFADGGSAFLSDSDTHVAWQLLAGVRKPLTDNVDVSLKYRFFNVDNVNTVAFTGSDTNSRIRSHSLLVGLTYNFGSPPPPPPPAPAPIPEPAPAPLPPCPPAAVTPGPFLVFFDWDRSIITPEAAAILDRAAEQYAATGQTSIALGGYADKSGKPDYNVALSQRRADAVKAYMVGKGVADGVITTEAFGETRPLVDTADGVREPQNRRVEITFGGAPAPTSSGPCQPQ